VAGLVGGGDVAVGVPFCGFLAGAVPFVSGVAARWEASLVENMRVNLSFMEPFSAGFCSCSMAPTGITGSPFRPFILGDLVGASTDLIDGGCEDRGEIRGEALGEADATECPEDVMMGNDRRVELWACGLANSVQMPWLIGNEVQEKFAGVKRAGSPGALMMQGLVTREERERGRCKRRLSHCAYASNSELGGEKRLG
jgi:hypothetical protein